MPLFLMLVGVFLGSIIYAGTPQQVSSTNHNSPRVSTSAFGQGSSIETVEIPISCSALTKNSESIFFGAAQGHGKEYALSYMSLAEKKLYPYAPAIATLNNQPAQENPLYDASIAWVKNLESRNLAIVTHKQPTILYNLNYEQGSYDVVSTIPRDSNALANNGIVALETSGAHIFAAIKGNNQAHFGQGASGIAVLNAAFEEQLVALADAEQKKLEKQVEATDDEAEREQIRRHYQVDEAGLAHKKIISKYCIQRQIKIDNNGTTILHEVIPFTLTSSFLTTNQLASMGDAVALHWCTPLKALYVGLQIATGADENTRANAIAVITIDADNTMMVRPFIDFAALDAHENSMVGTQGAEKQVSIHELTSMQTTTFLNYLIVHGGVGRPEQTNGAIYALPLVNNIQQNGSIPAHLLATHGTIASATGECLVSFKNTRSQLFEGRHFIAPAQKPHDITYAANAYMVGGNRLPMGTVTKIFAQNDAVCAIVTNPDGGSMLCHSQAIFDAQGKIASWTAWKEIYADTTLLLNAWCDTKAMQWWYITTGASSTHVRHTQWHESDELGLLIAAAMPAQKGGITAATEFKAREGITRDTLALMGNGTVMLVQKKERGINQGADQNSFDTKIIADPSLKKIGTLISADIVNDGTQAWLAVAGTGGIAFLMHPDGCGWPLAAGLQLSADSLQFEVYTGYKNIQKVQAADTFLYVLCDSCIERIPIEQHVIADGKNLSSYATRVADTRMAAFGAGPGIFVDMIASNKLMVVSHTHGLFRNADDTDIRFSAATEGAWTRIELADTNMSSARLIPITYTGNPADLCNGVGLSQVYVVQGNSSTNKGLLQRLFVQDCLYEPVSCQTVQAVHDYQSARSALHQWSKLPEFITHFAHDGIGTAMIAPKKMTQSLHMLTGLGKDVSSTLKLDEWHNVAHIFYSTVCGGLVVAGSNGILINN